MYGEELVRSSDVAAADGIHVGPLNQGSWWQCLLRLDRDRWVEDDLVVPSVRRSGGWELAKPPMSSPNKTLPEDAHDQEHAAMLMEIDANHHLWRCCRRQVAA